jgi:hypothetical protein
MSTQGLFKAEGCHLLLVKGVAKVSQGVAKTVTPLQKYIEEQDILRVYNVCF